MLNISQKQIEIAVVEMADVANKTSKRREQLLFFKSLT